jgi:hypothetical protein
MDGGASDLVHSANASERGPRVDRLQRLRILPQRAGEICSESGRCNAIDQGIVTPVDFH